jgi:hypothetical protein
VVVMVVAVGVVVDRRPGLGRAGEHGGEGRREDERAKHVVTSPGGRAPEGDDSFCESD